ncbi:MAG TPA: hypothetical protein VH325_13510 [Bryobacteraceae bacterium]|jgi:hypothetical protein|nr:hypothetical protein [Bryobacteraceae bacterium]
MKTNRESYRRLGRSAWLGGDHLLVVNARFFSERHMRLYRGDIETMVLYSLQRNQGALLVLECLCALTPLGVCAYAWWLRQVYIATAWRVLIPGIAFALTYAIWRFVQPNWACLLSTKTSRAGLVLGRTARRAKRNFTELVAWVSQVQGRLTGVESLAMGGAVDHDPKATKPYTQAVHAAAFACGASGWILLGIGSPPVLGLAIFALMTYYGLLGAAYFAQSASEFPFAVKSAAVMSQISAIICLLVLLSGASSNPMRFYFLMRGATLGQLAGISAVSFSIYGIVAMTLAATELPRPGTARRSVLGLEG